MSDKKEIREKIRGKKKQLTTLKKEIRGLERELKVELKYTKKKKYDYPIF